MTDLPTSTSTRSSAAVDAQRLAFDLRRAIDGEVRFDPGSRHLYATDASNFRQVPIGVVVPRSTEDMVRAVQVCRRHGAPITHRGGGTSLAGQACNVAVIIDSSKHLRRIVHVDPVARTATVEPGVVLDDLREVLAPHGLTWGPDPATHNRCTIGGMLGNDACGMHAFAYGRTQDNVRSMEVLLYDGTRMTVGPTDEATWERSIARADRLGDLHRALEGIVHRYGDLIRERYRDLPRRVSGYNLQDLLPERGRHLARALVGTEGTCVTILSATLELNPAPPRTALVVVGYDDVCAAGDAVAEIRHADGLRALEGMDQHLIDDIVEKGLGSAALDRMPAGNGWLLCEFGGDSEAEAAARAHAFVAGLAGRDAHVFTDRHEMSLVWEAREAGLGATSRFGGVDHWAGWEDSAVHPDDVGPYLRDLLGLLHRHGYDAAVYGHFGDGCIHCRLDFDLATPDGVAAYRRFLHEAADLVDRYGGSYSGEHGDGQQRGELLEGMYGRELMDAMRAFKAAWDPDDRMNPGKVVDARPFDADLRLGPDHRPWHPDTAFAYPDDDHDFARAQQRCVGVGKCRRDDGAGTMCPSYMVTHEEMHSTRGRARLLFEMLDSDADLDGWRDEHVREALDLCLSCKACANECPVNVDMATYKSEFLSHHYAGRLHPPAHYALGLIDVWSRLAQIVPGIANRLLSAPVVGTAMRRAVGVTTERPAPAYARQSFRAWFAGRASGAPVGAERVLLFADTFTHHFSPHVGRAAVEVLEDAGFEVVLPEARLCCGRPLYDHGFLGVADRYLGRLIEHLADEVSDGTRIVGLEPSCVAVLRDELPKMRPHDADANRLAGATYLLGEFLDAVDAELPRLERRALVHGHCHQKAVTDMAAHGRVLDRMGLDWTELDAGCCGLAGSFGYESGERYEVSVAAGERKLLPAVRGAPPGTLILTDGFSCASQIEHLQRHDDGPRRRALHLAEVIQLAKAWGPAGPSGGQPIELARELPDRGFTWRDWTVVGAGAAALAYAAVASRRR